MVDKDKAAFNRFTSVRIGRATSHYKKHIIDKFPPMGPLYFDENKEVLIDVFGKKNIKKTINILFDEDNRVKGSCFTDKPEKLITNV